MEYPVLVPEVRCSVIVALEIVAPEGIVGMVANLALYTVTT